MLSTNLQRYVLGVAGVAFSLLAWEFLVRAEIFSPLLLPSPLDVLAAGIDSTTAGTLVGDAIASLRRVGVGFGIGGGLGVGIGLLLGTTGWLHAVARPILELLRPIPGIAWIPLAILWFGIGDSASYFIVALTSFFPVFIGSYDGFRNVPVRFRDVAKNLDAGWVTTVRYVVVPGAMTSVVTGLRIGLGVAWATVIAAELVAATSGLGYSIALNRTLLQTPQVLAGMVSIGVLGAVMTLLFDRFIRTTVPWLRWTET